MTSTTTPSSPRILLVTPVSPWGRSSGTQQRTANLYNALSSIMPVDVLILAESSTNSVEKGARPEIIASLSWKQPLLTYYKYDTHRWVDDWCQSNLDWGRYTVVVSRYLTPITKVNWPSHLRTVVDCDDAIYRYTPERDRYFARVVAWLRTGMRYLQTALAVRRYDHTFYCSQRDLRMFPGQPSSILPNVVPIPAMPPPPAQGASGTALIVGSMWYPPNRDGVNWFLTHCWPAIATRCPNLGLRIIGSVNPVDRQRWERSPRTEVAGFVEDLAVEYARALFVVAPIQYGGGSCIKFLEASAFGRASVVTDHVHSAFGSEFNDGDSVAMAHNARQMVEMCATLATDARRRDDMGRRAYATASNLYNVEVFDRAVRHALQDLLPLRSGPGQAESSRSRRHAAKMRFPFRGSGVPFDIKKQVALKAIAKGIPIPEGPANRVLELVYLKRILELLDINCVLDVGANIGQFASELRGIGFKGLIVSFEPLSGEFARLQQAFHGDSRWRGFRMALGEVSGQARINVVPDLTVMSSLLESTLKWRKVETEEIEIRRLDDVLHEAVAGVDSPRVLLKMDTQGYDLKVFAGASASLPMIRGLLSEISVIPIYKDMPHYLEALQTYEEAGFELFNLSVVQRSQEGALLELNCLMQKRGERKRGEAGE